MNNLVVQLNDDNNNNILTRLDFIKQYYDGTESTYSSTNMKLLSTRYYWYGVPKKVLTRALHIIHEGGHQFKILPPGIGNCEFN